MSGRATNPMVAIGGIGAARTVWRGMAVAVGLAAAGALADGAAAQTVLRSPADIAACLCLEQAMNASRVDLDRQKQAYDAAKGEYERLDAQAQSQRSQVNVNDMNSITAYKSLLEQRDAAETRYKIDATPALAATVARYNGAVQTYSTNCSGKSYDTDVLNNVQKTLYCPK